MLRIRGVLASFSPNFAFLVLGHLYALNSCASPLPQLFQLLRPLTCLDDTGRDILLIGSRHAFVFAGHKYLSQAKQRVTSPPFMAGLNQYCILILGCIFPVMDQTWIPSKPALLIYAQVCAYNHVNVLCIWLCI